MTDKIKLFRILHGVNEVWVSEDGELFKYRHGDFNGFFYTYMNPYIIDNEVVYSTKCPIINGTQFFYNEKGRKIDHENHWVYGLLVSQRRGNVNIRRNKRKN